MLPFPQLLFCLAACNTDVFRGALVATLVCEDVSPVFALVEQ